MHFNCNMKEITIPDSVIKIEYGAFTDCTSLTKVKMSKNIEHVEDRAFRYVPWLEENKETFLIVNGVLIDGSKAKGNITLPKSVRIIAEGAFTYRECDITGITIPDTVKEIGAFAFMGCSKLKKVSLPNSITVIKSGTFMHCESLKSIKVPSTVTVINDAAFNGCDNLEEVTVTSNLNRIDAQAFGDCPKLDKIRGLGPNVSTYFNAIEPGTTKSKFYINNKTDQLKVGTKYQAEITNSDTKSKITWSVSDTTIATITNDGVLTGKKVGTVTVTAKCDGLSDSFQVQFFAPKKLDIKGPKELTVGETGEYSVIGLDNETEIEWTISDDPYEVYSPYEILPSITDSSAINFLPHLPGKVTLHAATGDSVGELIITIKDFEIIGPSTIIAGENAYFYLTSNGTDFSWVVYDDNLYNSYFGYGREMSFPTYAPGIYTIEVSHSDFGDKTWELTVEQGPTIEEE